MEEMTMFNFFKFKRKRKDCPIERELKNIKKEIQTITLEVEELVVINQTKSIDMAIENLSDRLKKMEGI